MTDNRLAYLSVCDALEKLQNAWHLGYFSYLFPISFLHLSFFGLQPSTINKICQHEHKLGFFYQLF